MQFQFKGLPQLLKAFPDDATARHYFEQQRWNGTPVCPFCASDNFYKLKDYRYYKCGKCRKKYTVTVGTIFHSSHIPLNIWFAAAYLVSSHKKGISSHQLAKDLALTQKTAWFMLHRLREMVREKAPKKLSGVVEVDETYMSRKYRSDLKNMSEEEKDHHLTYSYSRKSKGLAFGMAERDGKVIIKAFSDIDKNKAMETIKNNIQKHSFLFTDESKLYSKGYEDYKRGTVVHGKKEWVKGDINTNHVENFWSVMKRGIYGIYHQVSYKHLQAYCDEFSFRYNNRKMPDNERFTLSLREPQGRLKYSQLIANDPEKKEPYQKKESEWE